MRMAGFPAILTTVTTMREATQQVTLLRLMTWLSPAFPIGAFSYSHGIERAIHDGVICDRPSLVSWLQDIIERGSGWNDAVLLAEAWRSECAGNGGDVVAELSKALAGSRERQMETTLQGSAFASASSDWSAASTAGPASLDVQDGSVAYPVAVGRMAARHGIALDQALGAFLHAYSSNLIQAAVRLVPLGQRDGVAAIAELEPVLLATAECAAGSTLDSLGSATFLSEIAAMRHEVQYSRVFRS